MRIIGDHDMDRHVAELLVGYLIGVRLDPDLLLSMGGPFDLQVDSVGTDDRGFVTLVGRWSPDHPNESNGLDVSELTERGGGVDRAVPLDHIDQVEVY